MNNKQIGGPIKLNYNAANSQQYPPFGGIDHQALMNAHPITGVPPGMPDAGQQPVNMENKWQFGFNYGHIATSNFIKAGLAGLRRQNDERDFQRYNQTQSNPLLQIPANPNTSNASLYGQTLMKKGGLKKKQEGGFLDDEIESDIMKEDETPVIEQEAPQPVTQVIEEDYSDVLAPLTGARTAYMAESDDLQTSETTSTETPTFNTEGSNSLINEFKRGIAGSEGAGYFTPTQIKGKDGKPASSAFGKYQFIKGTREGVRKQFFPEISHTEFENMYKTSPAFQEQVMDAYSGHLLNKYGGDKRKAATAFFLGEGKVDKVNDPNYRPTTGNATVGQYLSRAKFQKGGLYKEGGSYYLTSKEIADLKQQGYEIEE